MDKVIDIRIRPPTKQSTTMPGSLNAYVQLYKKSEHLYGRDTEWEVLLEEMDRAGIIKGILLAEDLETTFGKKVPNERVASHVARFPDRFLGFAGVDPNKGMNAVRELEQAVTVLGLRGLSLWPCFHKLRANDRKMYPLYAKCVELMVPVTIHTSINFGRDLLLDYGRPIYLDEVAVDFPELKIIASHGGWPWVAEMVAVAWRHANVYIDISAMRPKYIGMDGTGWEPLIRYGDSVLKDKVLFGTNWPALPMARSVEEVKELPLKEETKRKWLFENAARLLDIR